MLKVIARVLRPSSGTVRVMGRIAPLLELGAGFDFELTGRENVYLNGAILGYSRSNISQRLSRIIEFAGLQDFIDAPLRTYSTGMIARLGFSIATDKRPDILIVDEILSVGDAEFQTRSFERIQSFQAEGTTILLVSHSAGKVEEMSSRVLWLDHGEIAAAGNPEAIIGRYLNTIHQDEEKRLEQQRKTQVLDETSQRWGNQRVEIIGVRITDERGTEQTVFQTGQTLAVHIEYFAHEPVDSPIFGIAIHRQDGAHITGPNTGFAGLDLGLIEGRGSLVYSIPYLSLLESLYHVSAAVVDSADSETFDFHDRLYPFRVLNHNTPETERFGLVTMQGEWQFKGGDADTIKVNDQ